MSSGDGRVRRSIHIPSLVLEPRFARAVETKWRGLDRAEVEGFKASKALKTDVPGLLDFRHRTADDACQPKLEIHSNSRREHIPCLNPKHVRPEPELGISLRNSLI